ncbi:MAG: M36 family metallopeptidase [bacterium]
MDNRVKGCLKFSLMFTFLIFLLSGFLYSPLVYGGPESLGVNASAPRQSAGVIPSGEDTIAEGALEPEAVIEISDDRALPVAAMGEITSTRQEAALFRKASGFDAFNTQYQNQWNASFSEKTGKVKTLYGFSSNPYEGEPDDVAKGFLRDSHAIFGLKPDLSDLRIARVDKTDIRDHVRLQQTYNGIPIVGVYVLVHSDKRNQVTMVQNSYIPEFQVANEESLSEGSGKNVARSDLQTSLGSGAVLSDAKAEKLITPYNKKYYYIWKIVISSRRPIGFWVYHVDAATGQILYKGNEMHSLRSGTGSVYTTNANWLKGKVSNVSLSNMFTPDITNDWGYLHGSHAAIYNFNSLGLDDPSGPYDYTLGNFDPPIDPWTYSSNDNPWPPGYRFIYYDFKNHFITSKPDFDATNAYYRLNTIWSWWNSNVVNRYVNNPDNTTYPHYVPYFSDNYPIPAIVNVAGLCDAYYDSDIYGDSTGYPGFVFGNEDSCAAASEDLVIDETVVRHEYTHFMMDMCGFSGDSDQFGGDVDYYGRAMGEGNADFFAFLGTTPKNPEIGNVAWAWNIPPYLRDLDNSQEYPADVDDPDTGLPEEHYTGEIWGGYLYDVYRILGAGALKYVFQSFYYFNPSGGLMDSLPDFADAIDAQYTADFDLTNGKIPWTIKVYGSQVSRGFVGLLKTPYQSSNYFNTGTAGSDTYAGPIWIYPPTTVVSTKANLLHDNDVHEYVVENNNPGKVMNLSVTVTSPSFGPKMADPYISLYSVSIDSSGNATGKLWAYVGPSIPPNTPTRAHLGWSNLPPGFYSIQVTGTRAVSGQAAYYNISISLQ